MIVVMKIRGTLLFKEDLLLFVDSECPGILVLFVILILCSVGRWATDKFVFAMESLGLAPPGSRSVSQLLNRAADALVEGGEKDLFTPMFFYKVRKPLN